MSAINNQNSCSQTKYFNLQNQEISRLENSIGQFDLSMYQTAQTLLKKGMFDRNLPLQQRAFSCLISDLASKLTHKVSKTSRETLFQWINRSIVSDQYERGSWNGSAVKRFEKENIFTGAPIVIGFTSLEGENPGRPFILFKMIAAEGRRGGGYKELYLLDPQKSSRLDPFCIHQRLFNQEAVSPQIFAVDPSSDQDRFSLLLDNETISFYPPTKNNGTFGLAQKILKNPNYDSLDDLSSFEKKI